MAWLIPSLVKLSFVLAVTGHGVDLAATENCLGAGRCRELNPWLVRFENPAAFGAAKMGLGGSTELLVYHFVPDHRNLVIAVNFTIGGTFTGIGIRNVRAAQRTP